MTGRTGLNVRFNRGTKSRNQDLRNALHLIERQKSAVASDLINAFGWRSPRASSAMTELATYDFIEPKAEVGENGKRRYRYTVKRYNPVDLDRLFPISLEMHRKHHGGYELPCLDTIGRELPVRRDPFDVLLMGHGVAPSILFRSQQHGSI